MPHCPLSGREIVVPRDEIIVSKTDTAGRITYANDVFLSLNGYAEAEVLGKPHSLLRHPGMPGAIFARMWDTVAQGREFFGYIANRSRDGGHYWVLAQVAPAVTSYGRVVGFHSTQRAAKPEAVARIAPLYAELSAEEACHADRVLAARAANDHLDARLRQEGQAYDQFVLRL